MLRKYVTFILVTAIFTLATPARLYQGIVMNSAETIEPWNFKLGVAPTLIFGKDGADNVLGISGKAGLGLTHRVDVEFTGAIFDNYSYFGIDAEYWAFKGPNVNISGAVGWHMTNFELGADSSGIDATLLASTRPVNNLEITGAVKFSFDHFGDIDRTATLGHFVPGLEYKISPRVDALAEFGIALTDDSWNYLSFGLAYYFRQ